jgi:hypothetical protein
VLGLAVVAALSSSALGVALRRGLVRTTRSLAGCLFLALLIATALPSLEIVAGPVSGTLYDVSLRFGIHTTLAALGVALFQSIALLRAHGFRKVPRGPAPSVFD